MAGIDDATVAAEIRIQLVAFHTQRDLQLLTSAVAIADPHQHRPTPMQTYYNDLLTRIGFAHKGLLKSLT